MEYRIAHSKFQGTQPVGKNCHFNRVVTSAWDLNRDTNVLTYGATVYKKTKGSDHWSRREHKSRAIERFHKNPVRVVLDDSNTEFFLNSIAVDWYIGSKLVFLYGTHDHQPPAELPVVVLPKNFNQIYRLTTPFNDNFTCEDQQDSTCHPTLLSTCYITLGACLGFLATVGAQNFF